MGGGIWVWPLFNRDTAEDTDSMVIQLSTIEEGSQMKLPLPHDNPSEERGTVVLKTECILWSTKTGLKSPLCECEHGHARQIKNTQRGKW